MGRGSSKIGGASESTGSIYKFSSKAESGFEYEYDGGDAEKFFMQNSNAGELIDQISNDMSEVYAFEDWTSGHFMSGQQYRGWDNMSTLDKQRTLTYDKYLDQATLDKGIEVSRLSDAQLVLGAGNKTASLAELRSMEGQVIFSKGSMSTGAAAEGLKIGSSSKNVEYHISIPGGTKGAGMWVGDDRINSWGDKQREFMTNRDIYLKVGKTTYNKARGIYEVDLSYVGRGEHDYGSN